MLKAKSPLSYLQRFLQEGFHLPIALIAAILISHTSQTISHLRMLAPHHVPKRGQFHFKLLLFVLIESRRPTKSHRGRHSIQGCRRIGHTLGGAALRGRTFTGKYLLQILFGIFYLYAVRTKRLLPYIESAAIKGFGIFKQTLTKVEFRQPGNSVGYFRAVASERLLLNVQESLKFRNSFTLHSFLGSRALCLCECRPA